MISRIACASHISSGLHLLDTGFRRYDESLDAAVKLRHDKEAKQNAGILFPGLHVLRTFHPGYTC